MANEPEEGRFSEEEEGGPVKSFLEHLEDLRWALIKSSSAIALAVIVCLLAGDYVVKVIMRPLAKATVSYPGTNQVVTLYFGTNRLGVFKLDDQQQAALHLGTNRFVALQLAPVTVTSGTNQMTVLALQPNISQAVAEQAQHMDTTIITLGPADAFMGGVSRGPFTPGSRWPPRLFCFLSASSRCRP